MPLKRLLHAGCGHCTNRPPADFDTYKEVRLDCDPMVEPDIVASIVAMPQVADSTFDAVLCSHVLEHVFGHEVPMALREFLRVLKPGGKLWWNSPDLQAIGGKLALDQADHALYLSGMGPVAPLDMIYGHRASVARGDTFMQHKTGFTASIVKHLLVACGFEQIEVDRRVLYELKATAQKGEDHADQEPSTEGELDGRIQHDTVADDIPNRFGARGILPQ